MNDRPKFFTGKDGMALDYAEFSDGKIQDEGAGFSHRSWQRITQRARRLGFLLWLCVLVPTSASAVYFGLLASGVYISESRFVVRSSEKTSTPGLGVLLQSTGFGSGNEEVRAAQGYILSRDGLRAVEETGLARRAWGNSSIFIFNRFNPLNLSNSFEDLFLYYQDKVGADFDRDTGITTLSVRAFSPAEAEAMNRILLERAEALVNQLNDRSQNDLVEFAESEVAEAQEKAREAGLELANYRNQAGVIDPERQATVQLQMISKLQDELISTRGQLAQLRAVAPANPQIVILEAQARSLSGDIEAELQKVAGGTESLSTAATEFQRLQLEKDFADRRLGAAMVSLQDAKNEALRKQVYVERIAEPSLPDDSIEPRRLRGILSTLLFSFIAWGILSMMFAGVREHKE